MPPVRLLVADDHQLIRDAIRLVLAEVDDFEIVGEARSGREALELVARTAPDLVLLDLRMPDLDGLECLAQITAGYPDVKVVILSAVADPQSVEAALARGAVSYVLKTVDPQDLAPALRQAVKRTVFHAVVKAPGGRASESAGLTAKELTVLRGIAAGKPSKEIAAELWVTEQTVKFHLTKIYRKLGVANRTDAARWAYEHGVYEPRLQESA